MDSLADQECSHVIQTKQEYETLLNQCNRAKREKEETERAAAREISRVKQEAALRHDADKVPQRGQVTDGERSHLWIRDLPALKRGGKRGITMPVFS